MGGRLGCSTCVDEVEDAKDAGRNASRQRTRATRLDMSYCRAPQQRSCAAAASSSRCLGGALRGELHGVRLARNCKNAASVRRAEIMCHDHGWGGVEAPRPSSVAVIHPESGSAVRPRSQSQERSRVEWSGLWEPSKPNIRGRRSRPQATGEAVLWNSCVSTSAQRKGERHPCQTEVVWLSGPEHERGTEPMLCGGQQGHRVVSQERGAAGGGSTVLRARAGWPGGRARSSGARGARLSRVSPAWLAGMLRAGGKKSARPRRRRGAGAKRVQRHREISL